MAQQNIVDKIHGFVTTTDGTTWVVIISYFPLANSVNLFELFFTAKDTSSGEGAYFELKGGFHRITGNVTRSGVLLGDDYQNNYLATATIRALAVLDEIQISVKGVASKTIDWSADLEIWIN